MNTIKIHTTQNIEIEYDLAGLGERVVARILDMLVIIAYAVVFAIIIANVVRNTENMAWVLVIAFLPILFYDLVSEVVMNGQSVGKRIMHIKVISLNGARPTLGQYMNRWLFRLVDFSLTGGVCALITVAASLRKQRLGDMVAGTTLIKTRPATTIEQTIYAPMPVADHNVTFPEVIRLTDKDMQLVKEVILIAGKTGQTIPAYHAAEKI
ncbi:MAG TPA: RDD family protein, partial [Chitinophagaceae bacterium]|nr:RDD family protein [Chitinophagaceae bacterium]